MASITVKLPDQLDRRLRRLAEDRSMSLSEVVREVLARGLTEAAQPGTPSVLDVMGDSVGKYSGPGDLSTNPKYLEGLGRD